MTSLDGAPDSTQQPAATSAGAGAQQFELAFQWDDGTFVSPFVRSSGESLSALASYLDAFLSSSKQECSTYVVSDLGCGDGRVLFEICPAMQKCLGGSAMVIGTGYDLDEELIALATSQMPQRPAGEDGGAIRSPRYTFAVRDICGMSVDDIVDTGVDKRLAVAGTGTPNAPKHIVFVFLLTTALEQLKPLIMELLPRVELFISNSWVVPYLDDYLLAKVGTSYVYQWSSAKR